ncbi:MAG: 30S ribosomal protein S4 [Candidatus Peribacteraceae bacterium]|nr:30S ribosomal protein S4 [Candidatus Peribacteraceae bacterium]
MKYIGPKARRCRRQGVNLYGSDKYDKILQRKPQPPGKSARDRAGRKSPYAQQLMEKQKVRDIYGLSERQFARLYHEASSIKGQTGDVFKQLLERRLDNAIYRAGFALTRFQARQFAGHGHFMVNGRRVTVPSYRLKQGDVVSVRPRSKGSPVFVTITSAHEKYLPPKWMRVDGGALKFEVAALPEPDAAEQAIDMRQVIEFYSRS